MTSTGSRGVALALAALLVLSAGAPAVAAQNETTTSTDDTSGVPECGWLDGLVHDVLTVDGTGTWANSDDPCSRAAAYNAGLEDMQNQTDDLTANDLRLVATTDAERRQQWLDDRQQMGDFVERKAYLDGETRVTELASNGTTGPATLGVEGRTVSNETISRYQMQLIVAWNTSVDLAMQLDDREQNQSLSADLVHLDSMYVGDPVTENQVNTVSDYVTLANGTEVDVPRINTGDAYLALDRGVHGGYVNITDSEGDITVMHARDYTDLWFKYQNASVNASTNVDTFAETVQGGFENGTINETTVSDWQSPGAFAQSYARDYENSSRYAHALAALSNTGARVPDLASSGTMDITVNGVNYTGMLVSSRESVDGWESNTTYNGANLTGQQLILTTNGETVQLERQFTVDEVRDDTGAAVQNVTIEKKVYVPTNTSEFDQRQEEIADRQSAIIEKINKLGADSGDGTGDLPDPALLLAGLGVVAVLLGAASMNGNNGGGRR